MSRSDTKNRIRTRKMKLKSAPRLTLTLLSCMLAIGIVSSAWGFLFGRKALKGITQPAISPTWEGGSGRQNKQPQQGITFLREEDILKRVKAEVSGLQGGPGAEASLDKNLTPVERDDSQTKLDNRDTQAFPIKSQDKDITFEVRSARRQGDQLILNVALTNNGSGPVQFLYTFLDVIDEQGRVLSATTTGLPAELQPNGKVFSGTIMIPDIALENAQKLSLKLQDYPNRDVELDVSNIPVVR